MLEGLRGTNYLGLPPSHHAGNWGFGVDSEQRVPCVKAGPVPVPVASAPKLSASSSLMQGIFLG